MKSIYETVKETEYLGNLTKVIEKAEMREVLTKAGEITLFCPNDSAFGDYPGPSKLDLDNVTDYETDPIGKIEDILRSKETALATLTDHLINKKINSGELSKMDSIVNAGGRDLPVVMSDEQVLVGNATIVIPDIECANGIIHIIDSLLMPTY
jgi:uncharacterized surface protein with fasciclin (FAS1) repeats